MAQAALGDSSGTKPPAPAPAAPKPAAAPSNPWYYAAPANPSQWASDIIGELGGPTSGAGYTSDLDFLLGWYTQEGGNWENNASFNPLNTTLQESGDHPINSVGVEAYPSWAEGNQATLSTLNAYPAIEQALRSGDASQVDQSGGLGGELGTWSGGGYHSVALGSVPGGSLTGGGGAAPAGGAGGGGGGSASSSSLASILSYLNAQNQAGMGVSNSALSQQGALGSAEQGITDQQLQQQLQDTLQALGLSSQSLGIQKKGLGQEQTELNQQWGVTNTQYGLTIKQLEDAYNNIAQQYGITEQGISTSEQAYNTAYQGLQTAKSQASLNQQQALQGLGASGVLNTGTHGQELQQYGLTQQGLTQQGESLQQQREGIQQAQEQAVLNKSYADQQNLLQRQQAAESHLGETIGHTYSTQQLQNQLAQLGVQQQQLGLQGTEARQQYTTGTQAAANQYADLLNSILLEQGTNLVGGQGNIQGLLSQLLTAGAFTGGTG